MKSDKLIQKTAKEIYYSMGWQGKCDINCEGCLADREFIEYCLEEMVKKL